MTIKGLFLLNSNHCLKFELVKGNFVLFLNLKQNKYVILYAN